MISCCWDTIRTFSQNHRQLQGTPGAIAVLHTHARNLSFHPHVHLVVPAAAIDPVKGLWRGDENRQNTDSSTVLPHNAGTYMRNADRL